jgi:hypothetical protein
VNSWFDKDNSDTAMILCVTPIYRVEGNELFMTAPSAMYKHHGSNILSASTTTDEAT